MRRRKRSHDSNRRRYEPTDLVPIDISSEEVMAELDPGWSSWTPVRTKRGDRTEKRVAA